MTISCKKTVIMEPLVLMTRKVFEEEVRENRLPNLDDFDKEIQVFKVPKGWKN